MAVHKYDMLKETWIYQEIQQQVVEEQRQRYIEEQQQIILEVVQARFPRLIVLTRAALQRTAEVAMLHELLVKVGGAQGEQEVRQYLAALSKSAGQGYMHKP